MQYANGRKCIYGKVEIGYVIWICIVCAFLFALHFFRCCWNFSNTLDLDYIRAQFSLHTHTQKFFFFFFLNTKLNKRTYKTYIQNKWLKMLCTTTDGCFSLFLSRNGKVFHKKNESAGMMEWATVGKRKLKCISHRPIHTNNFFFHRRVGVGMRATFYRKKREKKGNSKLTCDRISF